MSELTDKVNAAVATLKDQHGVTSDQVSSIVTQAISPFQTQFQTILASQKSDEDKIADMEAAWNDLTAGLVPAAPTPAPQPAPAPESAPDSAAS